MNLELEVLEIHFVGLIYLSFVESCLIILVSFEHFHQFWIVGDSLDLVEEVVKIIEFGMDSKNKLDLNWHFTFEEEHELDVSEWVVEELMLLLDDPF